jgi:glycosyltransferase involved in cell wall biosynthesis
MKILRVADVPNHRLGGMSRVMHFTGDALREAGHEVDYLFHEDLGAGGPRRWRRFALPWRIVRQVRQRQRAGAGYDVVEIHEPYASAYCFARGLGLRLPPAVAFSHGVEARGHRAALAYRRRKGLPVTLRQRVFPLSVVWPANYALRRCDRVVCLNSEDAAFVQQTLGVPASRIVRVRNGVGQDFLEAGEALAARPAPRSGVLFVGTWIERKGSLDLAPALASVLRDFPGLRVTLAGCGMPAGRVLADFPPDVAGRLEVIPHVASDADLLELYRGHAIFVLPSYFEGQPLSLLEAAALGLAPVTTNVCGMLDFVRPGENGLLVPPGDPDALAARLKELVRDPDRARQLGEAARRSCQPMTWANAARDLLAAYRGAAEAPAE